MGRGVVVVVAVASSALLLGCSSGGDSAADSTRGSAASSTIGAAEDPAGRYLDLVADSNCVYERLNRLEDQILIDGTGVDEQNWSEVQSTLLPLYSFLAFVTAEFSTGLAESTWPAEVQPEIDALVAQLDAEAPALRSMSASTAITEYVDLSKAYAQLRLGSRPSTTVRAKLGLEPETTGLSAMCASPS